MLTDRISLNIALKYLDQFEQTDGKVSNILFSRKDELRDTSKSVKFDDLDVLIAYIDKYTPLISFDSSDCGIMAIYELKSFSITNDTNKNFVLLGPDGYYSKGMKISSSLINDLNTAYYSNISSVKDVFGDIRIDEYILDQLGYIDCGYIEIHFAEAMQKIKQLYNKYKQI